MITQKWIRSLTTTAAAMLLAAACGCDIRVSLDEPPLEAPHVLSAPAEVEFELPPTPNTKPQPKAKATSKPMAEPPPSAAVPEPPPTPRPAWVDVAPGLRNGVYETTVVVGPESSRAVCEEKAPAVVEAAVTRYVLREFGPTATRQIAVDYSALESQVVADTWSETVTAGDQKGTFLHVKLRFDDQLRAKWRQAVDQWTTTTRTYELVRGLLIGLAGVTVAHVVLRVAGPRKAAT